MSKLIDKHCLNLHKKYVANWGVWEVAREIYANALDADPNNMMMSSPDTNTLVIRTTTLPNLAELFIVGCGVKTTEDDNIGQFGEGLKLAALVASKEDYCSLMLRLPNKTITFGFEKMYGEDVLHAYIYEASEFDGYEATLVMPTAGHVMTGRIINGKKSYKIDKAKGSPSQIFCKGIWICNLPEEFGARKLFSYNLNDIKINRDRSMVDTSVVHKEVGNLLIETMDEDLARTLIRHEQSWESQICLYYSDKIKPEATRLLTQAVKNKYGDGVLLHTREDSSENAIRQGYCVFDADYGLQKHLDLPLDTSIGSVADGLELIEPNDKQRDMIMSLQNMADFLGFPSLEVLVFKDFEGSLLGLTSLDYRKKLWLNETLFNDHSKLERYRTMIHELGHLHSRANDGSKKFEQSLDLLAGKLGVFWSERYTDMMV